VLLKVVEEGIGQIGSVVSGELPRGFNHRLEMVADFVSVGGHGRPPRACKRHITIYRIITPTHPERKTL
jgi:hypothetical protein